MINLTHVDKTYSGGVHALRNIDLKIDKGEFVFLTGPSGAGKSTLFNLICAFDKITSGTIKVANQDLERIAESEVPFFRRRLGVVFQNFRLLKELSVFENVALPLKLRHDRAHFIKKRVDEVLDQVGLAHKEKTPCELLSGGEQQRTAIARAIIHQPGILIADEPTGNLDPDLGEEIMALFEKVSAQGTTVFIATHDHALVSKRSRRRIELKDGLIVKDSK